MITFSSFASPPPVCFDHVVIWAQYQQAWVYVRRADRDTWECPGGHVEPGESLLDSAARELEEETGATRYCLVPVAPFVRTDDLAAGPRYGLLCYARIYQLNARPAHSEIGEVWVQQEPPPPLTYPVAMAALLQRTQDFLSHEWLATPMRPKAK